MNFDFIPAWANTIAQFEGFNRPGTRPARNHNPGDLKFAGQPGAIGRDSAGFAIFPDDVTGFQALYVQLQKYTTDFPNFSILDAMAHYLGQSSPGVTSQGNAYQYAAAVAAGLGVDISTTLGELAGLSGPTFPGPPVIDGSTGQVLSQVIDASGTATELPADLMSAGMSYAGQAPGPLSAGAMLGLALIGALILWFSWNG